MPATLGWEQEYFVIDEALFNARPDLVMCGRTVYGHTSARNQQLEDHYFGSIPERVYAYMRDFENEAYKLAFPCAPGIMKWPLRNLNVRPSLKK